MPREPGRNDPCPCGSGRKYKHCCLKAIDASDFLWRLLDLRKRLTRGKRRLLAPETVRDLALELRDLYLHIEDQVWNPRLPELRNTDGDKLVLTNVDLSSALQSVVSIRAPQPARPRISR